MPAPSSEENHVNHVLAALVRHHSLGATSGIIKLGRKPQNLGSQLTWMWQHATKICGRMSRFCGSSSAIFVSFTVLEGNIFISRFRLSNHCLGCLCGFAAGTRPTPSIQTESLQGCQDGAFRCVRVPFKRLAALSKSIPQLGSSVLSPDPTGAPPGAPMA